MAADSKPFGVVVLGMHRSGTSAVAGYLAKAGFFAGDDADLLPAAEDNPRGFFERADVNELNDTLLGELGGNWDRPPARSAVEAEGPSFSPRVAALMSSLESQAGGRPVVLKDPRICLLLPAWLPVLEKRYAFVVIDRPPVEVARSVRKRDGRPMYIALALWQLYCAEMAQGLAGRRALVVRYQDFVASPRRGPWLLEQLGQVLAPEAMATARAAGAAGFISSGMHHHQGSDKDSDQYLTGAQASLADWFAALAERWQDLPDPGPLAHQSVPALEASAEYYEAMGDRYGMETAYDLERHRALHFEQATELKDHHIENLEGELAHLRPLVEAQQQRVAELEAATGALSATNQDLRAQLDRRGRTPSAALRRLFG